MNGDEIMSVATQEPGVGPSYTLGSIKAIEAVKRRAGELIRRLAESRAKDAHRDLITTEDIIECIAEALRETASEATRPDEDR